VTNANNGLNQAATGPAACVTDNNPAYQCETGNSDYKGIKAQGYPITVNAEAVTASSYNGSTWWNFDTPGVIATKMNYVRSQGLGGAFFWEFNGDANGELLNAMRNGQP
jgi:chitinase